MKIKKKSRVLKNKFVDVLLLVRKFPNMSSFKILFVKYEEKRIVRYRSEPFSFRIIRNERSTKFFMRWSVVVMCNIVCNAKFSFVSDKFIPVHIFSQIDEHHRYFLLDSQCYSLINCKKCTLRYLDRYFRIFNKDNKCSRR